MTTAQSERGTKQKDLIHYGNVTTAISFIDGLLMDAPSRSTRVSKSG
jgi:hypothetical protein